MLTQPELQRLSRDLADTKVLSVYLDLRANDPAMRHAWMARLLAALRDARGSITDEIERFAFDRAAALLEEELPSPDTAPRPPGWVAFVTEHEVRHATDLAVRPGTAVSWRQGPVVGPYLRALKQERPVVVLMVDSRAARLYRYLHGTLGLLEELAADTDDTAGSERITGSASRGVGAPARGAVDTDAAQRRRLAAFRRLAASLPPRVARHAGDEGWVLVGGAPRWAQLAAEELPTALADRTLVSTSLPYDSRDPDIANAAKGAASELRTRRGIELAAHLVDQAGARGRGAAGIDEVERTLAAGAVDLLLVSHAFVRDAGERGEALLQRALDQGAEVEVLSTVAGERLDELAHGVVARLRFAVADAQAARAAVGATADARAHASP